MVAAALIVAVPALAQERDPFDADWAGDCGDAYCEIQVNHIGPDTYRVEFVLEGGSPQREVCRVGGVFKRHRDLRLLGRFGEGAPSEIVHHRTADDLYLKVSGHMGWPCGQRKQINGEYRPYMDE